MKLTPQDIFETLEMVSKHSLDIRTTTLALNIMDCASDAVATTAQRIYDKLCRKAEHLVEVADSLSREYGIPIINKRISVTPVAQVCAACQEVIKSNRPSAGAPAQAHNASAGPVLVPVATALDRAAKTVGVDFVGGFSAIVHKGTGAADRALIASIPEALSVTERVCASVNVASTRAGINMDALLGMAHAVRASAEATADRDSIGAAKLVIFANAVEDNPFMAGAFCGAGEADATLNVGVSGPGVVRAVLAEMPQDASLTAIAEAIKATAFKITRAGELIARAASKRLGVQMGILDLSLAPTPAVGDSVADILEAIGVGRCGAPGTTAALALLNDAVKKGGVMASSSVGGLSGAFIPVSEDATMLARAAAGEITLEKLEAMTSVCSVGLDMIAIPGDTPVETIFGIIADELAIGVINNKTTAARLIPAIGHGPGDVLHFGGLLGEAPVIKIRGLDDAAVPTTLAQRGGRFPAPINSLKN
ncbi:MAG: PFL family protein [Coriobacteriales bacterium]|jgi:uncharacterized protein (UPF0210 family)|nr:PFL family protein [Coriobacteriales bacterium]